MFAGQSAPSGWLIADGSPVSRTTYAALFTNIGTLWGGGDGVTTFNLPDFRGRSPLGYVNSAGSGLTTRAFASKGGEEAHVLTVAELASHAHGVNPGSHTHGVNDLGHQHQYMGGVTTPSGPVAGSGMWRNDATLTSSAQANISIQASGATGLSIQNTGSGAGHNVMHPYAVVLVVIKT